MKNFLFILLFLISSVVGHAQTEQYKFKQLTINSGLSHNQVNAIFKDKKGFVWIGTQAGLNRFDGNKIKTFASDSRDTTSLISSNIIRINAVPDGKLAIQTGTGWNLYDPQSEKFSRSLTSFFSTYGLPNGTLTEVIEDASGNFWFVMDRYFVHYNIMEKKSIILSYDATDSTSIAQNPVTGFASDGSGNNWAIHTNGLLEKIQKAGSGLKVIYRNDYLTKINKSNPFTYRIVADADGELWIMLSNDNQGVYRYNVISDSWKHYTTRSAGIKLNTDITSVLVQDEKGNIWIGTDHGGINIIDKRRESVRYIYHVDEDETSLGQNSVNTIYRDDQGIMWIGTYKQGLSYYHENIFRFPVYQHHAFDPSSLPYGDVNRFVEDEKGNMYIGTNGGGLVYFDRSNGTFKQYTNRPGDPESISSNVIVSLCIDHEKKLWIGTYYGGLNVFDGKKFTHYINEPSDPRSLSGRNVWEVFEDSRNNLWIGTLEAGVNRFDRSTQTFERLPVSAGNSIRSTYISEIMEAANGDIWFGTGAGIDIYKPSENLFTHYEYSAANATSLSNNSILDIHQDKKGRVWVGTFEGLNLFEPLKKSFSVFRERDGLPHNSILTIQEDAKGHLWLGTPNGLCEMVVNDDNIYAPRFVHYTQSDGLQSLQFNENAAYTTKKGELFFGGANGFNIFQPDQVGLKDIKQKIVFTDFQLFQKSVEIGETIDGRVVLTRSVPETDEIILPPAQNYFSIEFSPLNFFHSDKNEIQYKLEGLSSDWLPVDNNSQKLTFTGLGPGDYLLRLRTSTLEGTWNEQHATLAITILPPFWKTKFAFFLYMVILAVILYAARKMVQIREKMKFTIEHERQEAIRMHELDMMKIKFFTNVSHEFRTPLTLILTPLEKLIRLGGEDDRKSQYIMIQRNAKRLLNLVNQLLDFRKLEVQDVRFNPSEGNVIGFIRETVLTFSDLSEKKDIRLNFNSSIQSLETIFDQDKLEKILFNLLSNAFKFTPEHGSVSVSVNGEKRGGDNFLKIEVADTGIGIPADKVDKIFDRFFQNELPKTIVNQGSGIGLSITKEFVRIHGGEIEVKSEEGNGTVFTVFIPVREVFAHDESVVHSEVIPEVEKTLARDEVIPETVESDHNGWKTLLLIEDNDDFRFYLKDNLKQFYVIHEARNGDEGWHQTLDLQPDLIVSDVMMPGLNGIDLCRKIKNDERVSHIPVILLTARSSEEQKLEGIQTGADDYITKPFNFEILESRIKNLIDLRERSHKVFRKTLDVKASELKITPLDQKFVENAIKYVEQNVSSPDFSVEHLGRELGISRAYLYKKTVALTGKSPLEFIRTIRLQHAAQLLEKSQLTVAEVAYRVGFNNPKYFTKYFKEEFNILPSHYAASKKKSD